MVILSQHLPTLGAALTVFAHAHLKKCVVAGSVRLSGVSGRKHSVQSSLSLLKDQVLAQVDVLRKWKETTAYKYDAHLLQTQLGGKVRDYTFLHPTRLSRSPLRNQQKG